MLTVILVVGAVKIDTVPACWEQNVGTDTTSTCAVGERLGV